MSVRIENIQVLCLQDPQADYVRFEGSYQNVLVIVHGDNGLYGIGESDSPPAVIKALIDAPAYNHLSCGLAGLLKGEYLDDPVRLWHKMFKHTSWHGRHGVAIHAISALDIALWDLYARSEGKPLLEYFGPQQHRRLPAYATVYPMKEQPESFKIQIGEFLSQGFRRIKICVEPWWHDFELACSNLEELRAFIGPDIELMLDVALEFQHYAQLEPFIDLLEALDIKWLEAPFPLDNPGDHQRLKQRTHLPLGVGDLGLTTVREYQPWLDAGVVDIAQPDITMFGGVSEAMKLQNTLADTDSRIVPHGYNTDITIGVNAHFLAAQTICEPLEFSTSPSVLRRQLALNPHQLDDDGMIAVRSELPGLGVDLNWELIRECVLPGQ
ncbi:mandelate racemase/muconate lactonizing enzyme family protein [Aliamphritea hakodatensis]|uniref:mandelate racemase/muconate lactonizing enzyme family protein n=1 Tax=Aliamphritea hakodatensis TaxID=2895352 RepID=UPI0022FD92B1|nr:mandelate racemase/muconate lactonizing enzyme family protein [Aliamphritea hakodatensis]